jgi:hypothetical protein
LPPGLEAGEHSAGRQPGATPQDLRLRLLKGNTIKKTIIKEKRVRYVFWGQKAALCFALRLLKRSEDSFVSQPPGSQSLSLSHFQKQHHFAIVDPSKFGATPTPFPTAKI